MPDGSLVPKLLSQLTSGEIRDVVISMGVGDARELYTLQWEEIDLILQRRNYAYLRNLVFSVGTSKGSRSWDADRLAETMKWAERTLPASSARGIIRVIEDEALPS